MKIVFLLSLTICVILSITGALAQTVKPDSIKLPKSYWATLGLGGSTLGPLAAFTANAEIGNKFIITTDLHTEVNKIEFIGVPGSYLNLNDHNLLLGEIFKQEYFFISVSTGIGFTNLVSFTNSLYMIPNSDGLYSTKQERVKIIQKNQNNFNLPFMIQGYFVVAEPVAFGINAFLNLNKFHSTAGFSINIALGRMSTLHRKTFASEQPRPHQRRPPFPFL